MEQIRINVTLSEEDAQLYKEYSEFINDTLLTFRGVLNKVATYLEKLKGIPENLSKLKYKSDFTLLQSCERGYNDLTTLTYTNAYEIRDLIAAAMGWTRHLNLDIPANYELNKYYSPQSLQETSIGFNKIVRLRKEVLNTADSKISEGLRIMNHINRYNHKILAFSSSNKSIELIERAFELKDHELNISKLNTFKSTVTSTFLRGEDGELIRTAKGVPKKFGKVYFQKRFLEICSKSDHNVVNVCIDSLTDAILCSGIDCIIYLDTGCSEITNKLNKLLVENKSLKNNNIKYLIHLVSVIPTLDNTIEETSFNKKYSLSNIKTLSDITDFI